VRIEDGERRPLDEVHLGLTPAEAAELRDALDDLLAAPDEDRHHHVSSADYATELSVRLLPGGPVP